MIDIHCHILPGVDDGPQTLEESRDMLKQAAAKGVKEIVATSHFSLSQEQNIQNAFQTMKSEAQLLGITLYLGMEYDFSRLNDQEECQCIGSSKFVLVDFVTPYISANTLISQCDQLLNRNYKLLVAHPERLFGPDRLKVLTQLADMGAYFQINAGSFLGFFGGGPKRMADKLFSMGYCHVLGSDAHNAGHSRGSCLQEARDYIAQHYGSDTAEVLTESNARRILNGQMPLPVIDGKKVQQSGFFSRFLGFFKK